MANVSVTNIILIRSNENNNSINSFTVGIKPEWWTAIPYNNNF